MPGFLVFETYGTDDEVAVSASAVKSIYKDINGVTIVMLLDGFGDTMYFAKNSVAEMIDALQCVADITRVDDVARYLTENVDA